MQHILYGRIFSKFILNIVVGYMYRLGFRRNAMHRVSTNDDNVFLDIIPKNIFLKDKRTVQILPETCMRF